MSHKKFGAHRVSRFDVYWTQTNKQTDKQTDRQAKFIYRRLTWYIIKQGLKQFPGRSNAEIGYTSKTSEVLI